MQYKDHSLVSERHPIGDYVADLQFHMTLQARNLVPSIVQVKDSRDRLLQETQAHLEKLVSRQAI